MPFLLGPNWKDLPCSSWAWWFTYLVLVDETLTSDLHHRLFKFGKSNKCKGWHHDVPRQGEWVESLFFHVGKRCMFKSVRHLVTKNISIISSYASLHVWICTWNSLQMEAWGERHPIGRTLFPFQILHT